MFKKHIPKYIDTNQNLFIDASSFEEFVETDWAKKFTTSREGIPFSKWTKSDDSIIAIYGDYVIWRVVATTKLNLNLEVFSPPKREAKKPTDYPAKVTKNGDIYISKTENGILYAVVDNGDSHFWSKTNYTKFTSEKSAQEFLDQKIKQDNK